MNVLGLGAVDLHNRTGGRSKDAAGAGLTRPCGAEEGKVRNGPGGGISRLASRGPRMRAHEFVSALTLRAPSRLDPGGIMVRPIFLVSFTDPFSRKCRSQHPYVLVTG